MSRLRAACASLVGALKCGNDIKKGYFLNNSGNTDFKYPGFKNFRKTVRTQPIKVLTVNANDCADFQCQLMPAAGSMLPVRFVLHKE